MARLQRGRQVNDQRNLDNFLVEHPSVSEAALFSEQISMVGGQNDDAFVVETALLHERNILSPTQIHLSQPGRDRLVKTRIAFSRRNRFAFLADLEIMDILRLGVGELRYTRFLVGANMVFQ